MKTFTDLKFVFKNRKMPFATKTRNKGRGKTKGLMLPFHRLHINHYLALDPIFLVIIFNFNFDLVQCLFHFATS